jgi:hypothetical protein
VSRFVDGVYSAAAAIAKLTRARDSSRGFALSKAPRFKTPFGRSVRAGIPMA